VMEVLLHDRGSRDCTTCYRQILVGFILLTHFFSALLHLLLNSSQEQRECHSVLGKRSKRLPWP